MTWFASLYTLALSCCIVTVRCALYGPSSPVKTVDPSSFDDVLRTEGVSLVEFYSEPCAACTSFAKDFEAAATATKDVVGVYAVNDASVSRRYNVRSFPTLKVFLGKGSSEQPTAVEYTGALNVADVVTFTMKHLNKHVKAKVPAPPRSETKPPSGRVVSLNESEFNSRVLNDTYNQWLIMFFAPWCGHCKALEPEWRRMATIADRVTVGSVDATVNSALAQRYGVKGYPTIVLLPQGPKGPSKAIAYNGARKAEDILAFAKRHYRNMGPPVHVNTFDDLKQRCSGPLCLLFFLPEEGLQANMDIISKVMEKNSTLPFQFCYILVAAGSHPQWERALGVSSFPSALGLNLSKNVFSTMRKEKLTFTKSLHLRRSINCGKPPYIGLFSSLLPLNGGRGLVGDVVAHPADLRDVVGDPLGDGGEAFHVDVPGEFGGDEVDGHDDADDNDHSVNPGGVPQTRATGVGEEDTCALRHLVNESPGLKLLEHVPVGLPGDFDMLRDQFAENTRTKTWSREWVPLEGCLREAEEFAEVPDLLLKQQAHRLDEFEFQVFWETTDVVVGFDGQLAPPVKLRFEDIGVDGSLQQQAVVVVEAEFSHGPLELLDVNPTNHLTLLLGVDYTLELPEEHGRRVANGELDAGNLGLQPVVALLSFLVPHQPSVDHDTVEPLADSLVHNGRTDSAVHTTGKSSNNELVTTALLDDILFSLLVVAFHIPGLGAFAHIVAELLHDAVGLVTLNVLRVEAEAPDTGGGVEQTSNVALSVLHRDTETGRNSLDLIKVAAVGDEAVVACEDAVNAGVNSNLLPLVLRLLGTQVADFASEGNGHSIHGMAQGNNRDLVFGTHLKDFGVNFHGFRVSNAFGASTEYHTSGQASGKGFDGLLDGEELAGDSQTAEEADHGARLVASQVEYEDEILLLFHCVYYCN
ncbi:disulfide isomerase-related protein [Babesia ovata]|uniref:Disulfide isomerase-related protein n=1 Tax=Babesia ovata TaxID=189622 RepID=A0A2H6KBW1_9APIC|nr:disulfide isomerase-related protein [Babesia ovata]GBE60481.1 disulfide isomerase-related protein [Babesia ovata]